MSYNSSSNLGNHSEPKNVCLRPERVFFVIINDMEKGSENSPSAEERNVKEIETPKLVAALDDAVKRVDESGARVRITPDGLGLDPGREKWTPAETQRLGGILGYVLQLEPPAPEEWNEHPIEIPFDQGISLYVSKTEEGEQVELGPSISL